jgi:DNA-binding NarL/FixJ family response regulator
MDINMPRLNGIEATGRIKSRYPEITIIGLSVNADPDNQDAMIAAGADVLLPKEAATAELYRVIQEALKPRMLNVD